MNPFLRSAFICSLLFLALGLADSREETDESLSHQTLVQANLAGDCILPVSSEPEIKPINVLHRSVLKGTGTIGQAAPENLHTRKVQLAGTHWQQRFLDFKPELSGCTGYYIHRIPGFPDPVHRT